MKIPKYIDNALKLRTKYALLLDQQCQIVDCWLERNNIDPPSEDWLGGVELYVHPQESEKSVRDAILEN